jgi:hypothetical protein
MPCWNGVPISTRGGPTTGVSLCKNRCNPYNSLKFLFLPNSIITLITHTVYLLFLITGTALVCASHEGHVNVLERLLLCGADVNAALLSEHRGMTGLMGACARGQLLFCFDCRFIFSSFGCVCVACVVYVVFLVLFLVFLVIFSLSFSSFIFFGCPHR